jgi:ribosomal protein L29
MKNKQLRQLQPEERFASVGNYKTSLQAIRVVVL